MRLRVWYGGDSSTLGDGVTLEMLRNRVGCGAALRCCVAAVELIPTVDIRGPISEVDCRCRP